RGALPGLTGTRASLPAAPRLQGRAVARPRAAPRRPLARGAPGRGGDRRALLRGRGRSRLCDSGAPTVHGATLPPLAPLHDDDHLLRKLAELAVTTGANVQPGQVVAIAAAVESAPLVRAVADAAYRRGAKFVDAGYFDGQVKRHRIEHADTETLAYVPPWFGGRRPGP